MEMFGVYTGWNDKIVALEKTTWFHFRFMKTGFLFLLQCTNLKSDRSFQSSLKVTQCSTSESGDAPLYNSCSLWQQDHCQHPQNAIPDGSALEGTAQHIGRPFGGGGAEGHIMPPHIFEVGLKVNTKVYLDVLKSVMMPWCN